MKAINLKKLVSGFMALMLVLAVSISTVQAAPGDAELDQGLTLIEQGKHEDGVNLIIESAKKGNLHAMTCLGYIYLHGIGVEKDVKRGVKLIADAALRGEPDAQYLVGLMFYIKKDFKNAEYWLNKSADQGHPDAIAFFDMTPEERDKVSSKL